MLKPVNKYLVVEPLEEYTRDSGVIIPDDVRIEEGAYKTVTLLESHVSSTFKPGVKLLVPTHMVEEVTFSGKKYYLVLENCVIGYESE